MPEVTDAVKYGGAYKESDDFLPNPTDAYGTLDTSATAGAADSRIETVTPIHEVAKAQDAIFAAKALDPEDESVPASTVVLPDQSITNDEARENVERAAKGVVESPVEIGGKNPFQKQAAEATGKEGQEQAQEQQQQAGAGAGSAASTDTARQQGKTTEAKAEAKK